MNRLGLKISCFVVSVIIWVQVASTATVEQSIQLPLRLTGLADTLTEAGSDLPRQVRVRVQGSKLRLLAHNYLNRYVGEVRVNVAGRPPGPPFKYNLVQSDVFTDLQVLGIQSPRSLQVRLDREIARSLPVRLVMSGTLPSGVGFLAPPRVEPDSVLVTGPARFIPVSGVVATSPLDLGRVQESGRATVKLVVPHEHVRLASQEVAVRLQVAPVIERTLANVPVIALRDAGQPEVGVSPPVVDVMVRGVADSVRALRVDRVAVTVAVGSLDQGLHTLAGQVSLPPWLTLIGVDPPTLQVVIGDLDPSRMDSLRLAPENPRE